MLPQPPNYRVKRFGVNHHAVAQFQVLKVAVEGNDFDDLIAARDDGYNVDGILPFDAGNLSGDLHFAANGAVGENGFGFAGFRDHAVFNHHHMRGQSEHFVQIVAHHQSSSSKQFMRPRISSCKGYAHFSIEGRKGFVEQKQLGFSSQGTSKGHALFLSAREFGGFAFLQFR
jgi:hypothetical protein